MSYVTNKLSLGDGKPYYYFLIKNISVHHRLLYKKITSFKINLHRQLHNINFPRHKFEYSNSSASVSGGAYSRGEAHETSRYSHQKCRKFSNAKKWYKLQCAMECNWFYGDGWSGRVWHGDWIGEFLQTTFPDGNYVFCIRVMHKLLSFYSLFSWREMNNVLLDT
ncbi:hypothetical protein PUN28_016841 [Cardiocondyla obscurior]|uniref:Uncharacterized protein n=1 Tax=Cardiocondyla obscurior TaxID=286306 RepID=A0AAW2ESR0_9HYME